MNNAQQAFRQEMRRNVRASFGAALTAGLLTLLAFLIQSKGSVAPSYGLRGERMPTLSVSECDLYGGTMLHGKCFGIDY